MSEKHYPYKGGSFDRIVFDGDGSVWVPEAENDELRELVREMWRGCPKYEPFCAECGHAVIDDSGEWPSYECDLIDRMDELGVWEEE